MPHQNLSSSKKSKSLIRKRPRVSCDETTPSPTDLSIPSTSLNFVSSCSILGENSALTRRREEARKEEEHSTSARKKPREGRLGSKNSNSRDQLDSSGDSDNNMQPQLNAGDAGAPVGGSTSQMNTDNFDGPFDYSTSRFHGNGAGDSSMPLMMMNDDPPPPSVAPQQASQFQQNASHHFTSTANSSSTPFVSMVVEGGGGGGVRAPQPSSAVADQILRLDSTIQQQQQQQSDFSSGSSYHLGMAQPGRSTLYHQVATYSNRINSAAPSAAPGASRTNAALGSHVPQQAVNYSQYPSQQGAASSSAYYNSSLGLYPAGGSGTAAAAAAGQASQPQQLDRGRYCPHCIAAGAANAVYAGAVGYTMLMGCGRSACPRRDNMDAYTGGPSSSSAAASAGGHPLTWNDGAGSGWSGPFAAPQAAQSIHHHHHHYTAPNHGPPPAAAGYGCPVATAVASAQLHNQQVAGSAVGNGSGQQQQQQRIPPFVLPGQQQQHHATTARPAYDSGMPFAAAAFMTAAGALHPPPAPSNAAGLSFSLQGYGAAMPPQQHQATARGFQQQQHQAAPNAGPAAAATQQQQQQRTQPWSYRPFHHQQTSIMPQQHYTSPSTAHYLSTTPAHTIASAATSSRNLIPRSHSTAFNPSQHGPLTARHPQILLAPARRYNSTHHHLVSSQANIFLLPFHASSHFPLARVYSSIDDAPTQDMYESFGYEQLITLAERLGDAKPQGLEKTQIDRLHSFLHKTDEDDASSDQQTCVVCICEWEEGQLVRQLPCKHKFHAKCVDRWLRQNRTCPICRYEVTDQSPVDPPSSAAASTQHRDNPTSMAADDSAPAARAINGAYGNGDDGGITDAAILLSAGTSHNSHVLYGATRSSRRRGGERSAAHNNTASASSRAVSGATNRNPDYTTPPGYSLWG